MIVTENLCMVCPMEKDCYNENTDIRHQCQKYIKYIEAIEKIKKEQRSQKNKKLGGG